MHALAADQVESFHRRGFVGPFPLCAPAEMAILRAQVEEQTAREPNASAGRSGRPRHEHNRHFDCPAVREIATHPAVVGRVQSILGEDLLLWRAHFFTKPPGGKEIPWHQDYDYWPLEPSIVVSAWVALDLCTRENACLQVLPGSHRKLLPHVPSTADMAFDKMADTQRVDLGAKVDLEMAPGEFVLFNERMLHHSEPNRSQRRRMALALRFVPPIVRVLEYDAPDHTLIQVGGEDRMGFNRVTAMART